MGQGVATALVLALVPLVPAPAIAQDWHPLQGPQITEILERHVLRYPDGSEQVFNYGGLTEYRIGWPNEGRWRVWDDLYCALWPPSADWHCHKVAEKSDGRWVSFTDDTGHVVIAERLQD
jgi:hypothetical protein